MATFGVRGGLGGYAGRLFLLISATRGRSGHSILAAWDESSPATGSGWGATSRKGKVSMKVLKTFSLAAGILLSLAAVGTATPAQAQEPHYLAAISELRAARDYIQADNRAGFNELRHHANLEIDAALKEIKMAAWDDGKNTRFVPRSGGGAPWAPMHDAKHWLDLAKEQVQQGVDTPANTGLRDRASMHIAAAANAVEHMIHIEDAGR